MANFPTSAPSFAGFTSSHTLSADSHASQHNSEQAEIIAIAAKVGTGSSTPTSSKLMRGTGVGTSSWAQAVLTTDVTGTLPVANGGLGQASLTALPLASPAISGTVSGSATYTTPTLTTPVIADFTSATHNHSNNAGGGVLGTSALSNNTITADKLSLSPQTAEVQTAETTTSVTYTDLSTSGPAVTVTIGANGLALVIWGANSRNTVTVNQRGGISFAVSGATTTAAPAVSTTDPQQLHIRSPSTSLDYTGERTYLVSGLTAGSTTFTLKYQAAGDTQNFASRYIRVIPL